MALAGGVGLGGLGLALDTILGLGGDTLSDPQPGVSGRPGLDADQYVLKQSAISPEPTGNDRYDWFWKSDGTRVWTWRHGNSPFSFRQFDVSPAWSLVAANWTNQVNTQIAGTAARTFQWSPDGTLILTLQLQSGSAFRLITYNQSATPFDSTVLGSLAGVATNIANNAFTYRLSPDGLTSFIDHNAGLIDMQTLGTAFNVSTLVTSPVTTFDSTVDAGVRTANIAFSDDGLKLYSITAAGLLCSWNLSAPYDITSPSNFQTGVSVNVPTSMVVPRGLIYRADNGDLLAERDQAIQNVRCWEEV